MVLLSKSVLFVLTKAAVYAGLYLRGQKGVRIPAFLLIYPIASIVILYTFWMISVRYDLSKNISVIISIRPSARRSDCAPTRLITPCSISKTRCSRL